MVPSDSTSLRDDAPRLRDRRIVRAPAAPEPRAASILGRRDVAIVPWAAICLSSFAIALSTWLHGPSGHVDHLVLWGAVISGGFTAMMASIQDTSIGLRFRGSLWVYLLGSATLLAALAAVAVRQHGLATVFFSGNVMVAAYLGLVFPPRWAFRSIVVMLATSLGIQLANQGASTFYAAIVMGLIVAGWLVGLLGRVAHDRAASIARALSSYDRLTSSLNRRGYLEQLAAFLRDRSVADGPMAMLIIDLDEFKQVNDDEGHSAGDALLAWVGVTIPEALPASAELGRLGGDEFAVLLRDVSVDEASAIAHRIRAAVSGRISVSIGVATSQTRAVAADDLFRVADAALYLCKKDRTLGVHALVAGTAVSDLPAPGPAPRRNHPLSYAELRASGRAPRTPAGGVAYGWMVSLGLVVIACGGSAIVIHALLDPGHGLYDAALRAFGVPWVLWFVCLAWLVRKDGIVEVGRKYWVVFYGSNVGLAIGVGCAMLAHGGLVAPIGAALFLKVQFDAAILPREQSVRTFVLIAGGWLLVTLLGPSAALWVVPYHLALFASSYALGSISHRAFDDVTAHSLSLARTDALTGVRNRLGFEEDAAAVLAEARVAGEAFALLAFDLDDFKGINDTHGHAAGDELLRRVGFTMTTTLPDALVTGRLGGDEFVAAIAAADPAAASRGRELAAALSRIVGASVGHAVFPQDGDDLGALMVAADGRSYAVKRSRKAAQGSPAEQNAA